MFNPLTILDNPVTRVFVDNPVTRGLCGYDRSIGVIGMGMSGKTVFLTSLIDHLRNHDPELYPKRFDLGDYQISEPEFPPLSKAGIWDLFRFKDFRAQMSKSKSWPARTTACSAISMTCKFTQRKSGWLTQKGKRSLLSGSLTFYDIPGQRTTDVALYENDYTQWSTLVLESMRLFRDHHDAADGEIEYLNRYLQLMENPGTQTMAEIVHLYKLALMDLYWSGCSNITPAVFLLDDQGKTFHERRNEMEARIKDQNEGACDIAMLYEELAKSSRTGCESEEFAPLGQAWQKTAMAKEFSRYYQHYRTQYVKPLFGTLISCDSLVFLIDIPTILQHGVLELNMYREILTNMLKGLKPGDSTLRWLLSAGFSKRIERIAFAASQCDRFHPEDREVLLSMLKRLIKPVCNNLPIFKTEYFCISSVVSAVTGSDGKMHMNTADSTKACEYWRIPKEWNGDFPSKSQSDDFIAQCWEKGALPPRVEPCFSDDEAIPPKQIGMDDLFRFLTRW